ncbi:MAG: hypothetical protein M3Y36_08070, partial [Actinomycetota bacterium]|nr:hypothetical protein [Actinomycetota bacterium]
MAVVVVLAAAGVGVVERQAIIGHLRGCAQDPNGWDGFGRTAAHLSFGTNPEHDPAGSQYHRRFSAMDQCPRRF